MVSTPREASNRSMVLCPSTGELSPSTRSRLTLALEFSVYCWSPQLSSPKRGSTHWQWAGALSGSHAPSSLRVQGRSASSLHSLESSLGSKFTCWTGISRDRSLKSYALLARPTTHAGLTTLGLRLTLSWSAQVSGRSFRSRFPALRRVALCALPVLGMAVRCPRCPWLISPLRRY